jgi:hypothetical protein
MWLGLLHITADERDNPEEGDVVIIHAYEPHRVFTLAAPPAMVPILIRGLREAAADTGGVEAPRCGGCGDLFELPPLDDMEAPCGSV